MKLNVFIMIFAGVFQLGSSAFAAEVAIGQNHLVCENEAFGLFDFRFDVVNKVVDTQFQPVENAEPIPIWETLETRLTNVEFTSGKFLVPPDTKGSLPGASLVVMRYAEPGSVRSGVINAALVIPKALGFPIEVLFLDHNHPAEYETNELGATSFLRDQGLEVQLFFKCRSIAD